MGMISEFKDFINKGNVMDLAIGVIIGGAFGKIISSFVDDLIAPLIGMAMGGANLNNLAFELGKKANEKGEMMPNLFKYGSFIQGLIDFLIIAFVVFLLARWYNNMRKSMPPAPPPASEILLTEIRDLLKK